MLLAVHVRPGSYSDRWLQYLEIQRVPYKCVDVTKDDVISNLSDCDGLMWHWYHADGTSQLFARQLTYCIERMGVPVFPSYHSAVHYDDKIAQKYLYECVGVPHATSYVFYDRERALEWAKSAKFPKVYKLRCGAGASNVSLVKSFREAKSVINTAFSRGVSAYSSHAQFSDAVLRFKRTKRLKDLCRVPYWAMRSLGNQMPKHTAYLPRQVGYAYFQEYIPNNKFDDRVIVIGRRAFGIRRFCRDGDFRASGSGVYDATKNAIPLSSYEFAFRVANKIGAQSLVLDLVYDQDGTPLVIESSFAFLQSVYYECEGFFDDNLVWHDLPVEPVEFIAQDFIELVQRKLCANV